MWGKVDLVHGLFYGITTQGQILKGDLIAPWSIFIFKSPQKPMHFFPAARDAMTDTTAFTIECHEAVQNWKYSRSFAVGKNLILL